MRSSGVRSNRAVGAGFCFRLTPESFLAATLILEEAGGCVLDLAGKPLGEVESLLSRTSLVAAATRALAHEVLDVFVG